MAVIPNSINYEAIENFEEFSMYFIGFFYADGNLLIPKNRINVRRVAIYQSYKDSDILEHINKVATPLNILKIDKRDRSRIWEINNKRIYDFLCSLGLTQAKSLTVRFPKWISEKENKRHFLRGLLDGDGWVSICKTNKTLIIGYCGNPMMVEGFEKEIHNTLGIRGTFTKTNPNNHKVTYVSAKALQLGKYLYEDSTISINRKIEKFYKYNNDFEKRKLGIFADSRTIFEINKQGEIINEFPSLKVASMLTGLKTNSIGNVLSKRRKYLFKRKFVYK